MIEKVVKDKQLYTHYQKLIKYENVISNVYKSLDNKYRDSYFLYFVTDGYYVKIGFASNLNSRISNIQNGNFNKIVLLKYAIKSDKRQIITLEKSIHRKYELYKSKYSKEWFDLPDIIALEKSSYNMMLDAICEEKNKEEKNKTIKYNHNQKYLYDFDEYIAANGDDELVIENMIKKIITETGIEYFPTAHEMNLVLGNRAGTALSGLISRNGGRTYFSRKFKLRTKNMFNAF